MGTESRYKLLFILTFFGIFKGGSGIGRFLKHQDIGVEDFFDYRRVIIEIIASVAFSSIIFWVSDQNRKRMLKEKCHLVLVIILICEAIIASIFYKMFFLEKGKIIFLTVGIGNALLALVGIYYLKHKYVLSIPKKQ